MKLDLVTAPTVEPLTATEAKAHLRVDYSTDDTLIASLIVAAREYVEQITGRALLTQTWDLFLDRFSGREIDIPCSPLISVTSVKYIDTAGSEQTLSTDDYTVRTYSSHYGEVGLNFDADWPSTRRIEDAVYIRFVAGYGATSASVPQAIRQAMLMLVGHWYENRESVVIGGRITATEVPMAVTALLQPHRTFHVNA